MVELYILLGSVLGSITGVAVIFRMYFNEKKLGKLVLVCVSSFFSFLLSLIINSRIDMVFISFFVGILFVWVIGDWLENVDNKK
jgi:hypothetical protein